MVKRIKVSSHEEFEQMIQNQDLKISRAIVDIALQNLKSKKRFIPVMEVMIEDEDVIFDITLDRNNLTETLQQNLEIHEAHEEYEMCQKIASAIKDLNK